MCRAAGPVQSVLSRPQKMYHHGKYADNAREPTTHAQWWLTAGCCGLVVTLAFVGLTLWLGIEGDRPTETASTEFRYHQVPRPLPPVIRTEEPRRPSNRGRVEKVHKEEEERKPTHLKLPLPQDSVTKVSTENEETRTYEGPLDKGEDIVKDTIGIRESTVKKKSEAIYPTYFDPELFSPHSGFSPVVDTTSTNDLPAMRPEHDHGSQQIPPFTYIKDSNFADVKEKSDNVLSSDYESAEMYGDDGNSLQVFFNKRLQDVREWMSSRGDSQTNSEWIQMLSAFNQSVTQKNLTAIMSKLKEMYNSTDISDVPVSSLLYPDAQNGSSLLSFGLLAVDLFLLHNVQQIAWTEESQLGERMLEDPEVVAMNALFLPPDRVRQLRQKGSRLLKSEEDGGTKGLIAEALEFVNSILRAVLNLNKAFRSSSRPARGRQDSPNTMDCMWTLYCRNLDKTAKLHGPYGFLAKMNR